MVAWLALAAVGLGRAQASTSVCHDGYTVTTWQTDDGLPQNTVTAITQTDDGYLWVGTMNGLARFDGVRFQVFDRFNSPGLADARITALYQDSSGTLWIGHNSGAVTRYRAGVFTPVGKPSYTRKEVERIAEDAHGKIWLLCTDGKFESVDGDVIVTRLREPGGSPLLGIAETERRAVWVAIDGNLFELRDGALLPVELGGAKYSNFVFGVGAAAGDKVWVAHDERLRLWKGTGWDDRGPSYPWQAGAISRILELRSGGLAVGTMQNGLFLLLGDGRVLKFDYRNSAIQNWTRFLYQDREGNLWLGAGSGGLSLVRASGLSVVNPPDNWQGRTTLSIKPAADGSLWVGTEGAGVYHRVGDRWTRYDENAGLRNPYVWALAFDATEHLQVGTWGGGIFRLNGDRFETVPEFAAVTEPGLGLDVFRDTGDEWIATGTGALQQADGNLRRYFGEPGDLSSFTCGISRDTHGTIWVALNNRGVGRIANSVQTVFSKRDGLSSDSAQCLLADGDTLWIGTSDAGLNRLRDGKFAVIDRTRGLVSNVICHIADDQHGYLWISTHNGIMRIAKEELNRCADGRIPAVTGRVFDKTDGLPTLEFSGGLEAAGCRTSDGRLWFTSNKGLVVIDPAAVPSDRTPPPVAVESMRVDGRTSVPDQRRPARLDPDHNRLEFNYTALTLTGSNKVVFRYRLIGLDHEWIEAGVSRKAVYSQLPAGSYRFEVVARHEDGDWSAPGPALTFSVLPHMWQTWWFRAIFTLCVLSSVAVAARVVTRRRMQQRMRELEYERGIERERARIAQDIHDEVGSSLTRISLLSQALRGQLEQPRQAEQLLDRIHGTATEVTASLDEIVWAVNPRHDTLDSLASYMTKFAQETLAAAQVRCRLDVPVNLPAWPLNTRTRHNLLLAFKEALHNALKHAGATEIRISLNLKPHEFIVCIEDNGRGFDVAQAVRRNGLNNLERRLLEIAGRFEIEARTEGGTRVRFVVHRPSLTRTA